jgi:hypothetical protein
MPKARCTSAFVDDDVDLAADLAGELADRPAVGEVERHQRHLAQAVMSSRPGSFFHGSAWPSPDDLGARLGRAP